MGLYLLLAASLLLFNHESHGAAIRRRPMENPNLFEGDIVDFDPFDRTALTTDSMRWPSGIVPYSFSSTMDAWDQSQILQAMKEYEKYTCIRFKKRTNEFNYVVFAAEDGCSSMVGMTGGEQTISLAAGCMYHGTILHEIGHALGFFHEHSRPDRNNHLYVFKENIDPQFARQFDIIPNPYIRLLTEFDTTSVMMYGSMAFAKDDYGITMLSRYYEPLLEVYMKTKLSDMDIMRVKKLYRC